MIKDYLAISVCHSIIDFLEVRAPDTLEALRVSFLLRASAMTSGLTSIVSSQGRGLIQLLYGSDIPGGRGQGGLTLRSNFF